MGLELDADPQVWFDQYKVEQDHQPLSSGPCASVNAVWLDSGAFSIRITVLTHV